MTLSVGAAFFYRKEVKEHGLIIFLPFLLLTLVQEGVLTIATLNGSITSTALIYNIYRPVNIIVLAYIYYRVPFLFSFRKFILGITIFYLVLVLINYGFIESMFTTSSYLILARCFVILFYAIFFLYRYFNLDNEKDEKTWRPYLWITAGVVIFFPVVSISTAFQKFLAEGDVTVYDQKIYQLIPKVMSVFMYSCFAYAFYLCKKIK